jgi:antitoxin ParD1/3/4
MAKNTSVMLGDYFETFIKSKVESGRYGSASEVVRTALRLLESEEEKLKEIRTALKEGEKSKMISNFNAKDHLQKLHRKHL